MIAFKRKVLFAVFLILPMILFGGKVLHMHSLQAFETLMGIPIAYAREIENEEDDEYEWENEFSDDSVQSTSTSEKTSKKKSKPVIENVVEYKPVTKRVPVVEPAYATDTDKDGLVDALDPDPNIDQRQYFTDDDNDGMPNVWDKYPNEDDFSFLDGETDTNQNGLIDAYEE